MRKYDIDKGRYFGQRWQASVLIVSKYNLARVRDVCHTNRNVRKVWFLKFFKNVLNAVALVHWLICTTDYSIPEVDPFLSCHSSGAWNMCPKRENRVRTSRKTPRADLNCVIEFDRKAKGALLGKKKLLYYRCSTSYPGQFTDWRNWQGTGKLACVANVSVRFRSKERGTRVKDSAKNGATKRPKRTGRGWGRTRTRSFVNAQLMMKLLIIDKLV